MIASVGVDGVKIIANFGGMFAALIIAAAAGSLIVLIKRHKKYDITEWTGYAALKSGHLPDVKWTVSFVLVFFSYVMKLSVFWKICYCIADLAMI